MVFFCHANFCQHSGVYVKLTLWTPCPSLKYKLRAYIILRYILLCVWQYSCTTDYSDCSFLHPPSPPAVEKGDTDRVRLCHCLRDLSILFSSLLTTSIIITIWKTKLKSFRQQRNGSQKSWQTVGEKMNLSIQSIPFLPLRQSHQSSLLLKNWEWKSLRIEKWKWKIMRKKIFLTLQSIPFLSLCCWTPLWRPALARMWSPFAWKWLRIMWSAVFDFFFTIWVGNWSFGKL